MGKDLQGKVLPSGITQRKTGIYRGRFKYNGETYTRDNANLKELIKVIVDKLPEGDKLFDFDKQKISDYDFLIGTDEAGRGPLVGPVVACAVILPKNYQLAGLTDSKKLSEKRRNEYYI